MKIAQTSGYFQPLGKNLKLINFQVFFQAKSSFLGALENLKFILLKNKYP